MIFIAVIQVSAANNDSLNAGSQLEELKVLIEQTNRLLEEQNRFHENVLAGIDSVNNGQQVLNDFMQLSQEREKAQLDSLKLLYKKLSVDYAELNEKSKMRSASALAIRLIGVLFIVVLLLYIIRLRKDAMSYLPAQAKEQEEQGKEITDKANILGAVHEQLREMIAANHKRNKEAKKNQKNKKRKSSKKKKWFFL